MQVTHNPAQIRQYTARYQQHHDALGTRLGDGFPYLRIENIVAGYGAIEIQGERCEFHTGDSLSTVAFREPFMFGT